ncbi:MAG: Kelch repeat-containing protein [Candidatus Hodarchaeales archaeon]|jgi:hypothetical protein
MNIKRKNYAILMTSFLLIGNVITSITIETSIIISGNETDIPKKIYLETLQNSRNQPGNENNPATGFNYAIHSTGNIFEDSNEFINGSMTNLTINDDGYLLLEKGIVDNWKNVTTSGPSPRSGHAIAYDSNSNKVLLFGGMYFDGRDYDYFFDTWVYDLVSNNWTEMQPEYYPSERAYHSMVYDSEQDKFILYGGYGRNDMYEYDCLDDVWFYDLTTDRWDLVEHQTSMGGRCGHTMVYDFFDGQVIVFGGMDPDTETYFDDTWLWDVYEYQVEMWNETQYLPLSPSPRAFHSMVIDSIYHDHERSIILFGGLNADGELGETWRYDFGFWTQLNPSTSPSARFGHSMVYNPYTEQTILFGGCYFDSYEYDYYEYGDTWFFDHSALNWTQLNPSQHPSNRGFHTMVFSPIINKTILFGGCNRWEPPPWGFPETYHGDTWIYLGSSFCENGTYLSQVTDFDSIYQIDGNISWNSILPVQETSLEVQIGFSNNTIDDDFLYSNLNTSNFSFTVLTQCIRYRVVFKSDLIQNSTPLLEWVGISYTLGKPKPEIQFSAPQNNSLAEGLISIYATASSPNGIENVSFYIGGLLVICMYNTPYNFSWNSETAENGYIEVEAKAMTVLGGENSCTIRLLVNNYVITAPTAPINLNAIAKDDFITLNWTDPVDDGGSPILLYNIYRGITTGEYIYLGVTTDTNFTDDNVIGGIKYFYVVTAVNIEGESSFSEEVNITFEVTQEILFTAPSAPKALSASVGENHVELSWTTPSNDGGSTITGYRVYRGTTIGIYTLIFIATTTSYNDTLVLGNSSYYYVVTAINTIGESSFSNEVKATPTGISIPKSGSFPGFLAIFSFLFVLAIFTRKAKVR